MGLTQKRAIAQLQEETLPKYQAELDAAVGAHIELAPLWESYADQDASVIERHLPNYGLAEVVKGIALVCKDELGKSAVQEAVTKVELRYPQQGQENVLALEGKVLTILLGDPGRTGYWPGDRIAQFLEKKL